MQKYKDILISAIQAIDEKYFLRHERDFTYELYHKLREINLDIDITAETPKNSYKIPKNLVQNSTFKNFFFSSENFDMERNNYNRTPDLLFHEFDNKNKQLLACEIKPLNKRNNLIYKDLAKLLYYTESSLRYEIGILILFAPNQNERKFEQLKSAYKNILINFPDIEIWIVYPKRVHVVWANGKVTNDIY